MNRAGTGPSPLVLFPVPMICISALFILLSLSPFKISSNQTLPVDEVLNRAEQNDGKDEDVGMIDKGCDLFNGRWLPDMRGSAYTNWTCPTVPTSKNYFLNGREDRDFVNWRWKPDGCDLPRFDPTSKVVPVDYAEQEARVHWRLGCPKPHGIAPLPSPMKAPFSFLDLSNPLVAPADCLVTPTCVCQRVSNA